MIVMHEQKEDTRCPGWPMPVFLQCGAVMLESGDDLGMGCAQPRDDKRIVSDLTGSLKRFTTEGAAIDRGVGLLDRFGADRQRRHLPEFALIFKRGPQSRPVG